MDDMKIKEFLRLPGIKWVNHFPKLYKEGSDYSEQCLLTAIQYCYPTYHEQIEIIEIVKKRVRQDIPIWNDLQTSINTVLAIMDELDI